MTKFPFFQSVEDFMRTRRCSHYLKVALLYGSGLQRIELVGLRVRDIDFDYRQMRVINGKGGRHRLVTLANELLPALRDAGVWLPDALTRKYPNAPFDLGWHYLFPASRLRVGPAGGCLRRHHFDENNLNW